MSGMSRSLKFAAKQPNGFFGDSLTDSKISQHWPVSCLFLPFVIYICRQLNTKSRHSMFVHARYRHVRKNISTTKLSKYPTRNEKS